MKEFKPIRVQDLKKGQTINLECRINKYHNAINCTVDWIYEFETTDKFEIKFFELEYPVRFRGNDIVFLNKPEKVTS